MALVPKDLMEHIAELERLFTISTEKMNSIVDRFVTELEKGMLSTSTTHRSRAQDYRSMAEALYPNPFLLLPWETNLPANAACFRHGLC